MCSSSLGFAVVLFFHPQGFFHETIRLIYKSPLLPRAEQRDKECMGSCRQARLGFVHCVKSIISYSRRRETQTLDVAFVTSFARGM